MNILVFNGSADLYGANRILFETFGILSKQHKIILVIPKDGEFVSYIEDSKLDIQIEIVPSLPIITRSMYTPSGILRAIKDYRKSKKIINDLKQKYQADFAYINTLSCFFCIKISKSLNLKPLVHVHEIIESPKFAANYINKYAAKWADNIIAVSEAVRENLLRFVAPKHQQKVTTVLNGIPDIDYAAKSAKTNSKIKITLIARIKPEKGIWFFLEAIQVMGEIANRCEFFIVGGAAPNGEHYINKLKESISKHKYKNIIFYKTFMPDVSDLQVESDIIVVPSIMRDPFPTTILEAMRAKKPVIATNHGGSVQSVTDNVTGYLIKPSDVEGFATAMKKLALDERLRLSMGQAGREKFLEMFTFEKFGQRVQQYFDRFYSEQRDFNK